MKIRKKQRQVKVVIGISICLLLIMTVGYAAFSTNLAITAKGNINNYNAAWQLKKKVVTEGNGLYEDIYEPERYIYRGSDPDNYIKFNNELWRIIAIENDDSLKIIRNEILTNKPFDELSNRLNSTYCQISKSNGCGVFAKIDGIYQSPNNKYSGTVLNDSTLNTYLNNTYYYSLTENAKNEIIAHKFNIGAIDVLSETGNDSLEKNIASEKMYTWVGKIGLANATDALKASTNKNCVSATDNMIDHKNTCNDSYFFTETHCWWWLINNHTREDTDTTSAAWIIYGNNIEGRVDGYSSRFADGGVKPTVFLKPDIKLLGSGTETDPYIIK